MPDLGKSVAKSVAKILRGELDRTTRARQYKSKTALILRRHADNAVQSRIGRFVERADGTLFDGIGYEPAQIPEYFRLPTGMDARKIETFNRRIRKLQQERQEFQNQAWERANPLSAGMVQAAARQRAAALRE